VAALAGVPKPVIRRAKKYLEMLEEQSLTRGGQADLFAGAKATAPEPEPAADPLREELERINPDGVTPREALELLYRLKKL
jgi:DNA mismatch repair protein MutS